MSIKTNFSAKLTRLAAQGFQFRKLSREVVETNNQLIKNAFEEDRQRRQEALLLTTRPAITEQSLFDLLPRI